MCTVIKNEIALGLEKICKCIYFLRRRKIFKSCKLNQTSSVVTVRHESDTGIMECHNYCQSTFQYRIDDPTGNAGINSIYRTFRYLLSIEFTVAELRKICHCELRRIAQSTITTREKAVQWEKSRTRAQEREGHSAIGLETAALIDATRKRGRKNRSSEDEWERRTAYTCEGNSGDSAVFEYAGEKRKRK